VTQIKDLTKGKIPSQIVKLAFPIIGTSFIQMAYNLSDMAWLGRVGSETVGAVGIAIYFVWFASSIMFATKIGAEVGISQAIGEKDNTKAIAFAQNSIVLSLIISIIIALGIGIFPNFFVSLFNIESSFVNNTAVDYLKIISLGIPFTLTNIGLAGVYNGSSDTRTPFIINSIGLAINIILDPLLIFGFEFIPALGATGAAIATVFSQIIVFICFVYLLKQKKNPLNTSRYICMPSRAYIKKILIIGGPVAIQASSFAAFAMALTRVMNNICVGDEIPMSVQTIGSQVEALSWMTASGFATALGTFTGQNYGANRWDRIQKGFFVTVGISSFIGILSTMLFYFAGSQIFGLFINSQENEVINLGVVYLIILSFSQIFMCIEISATGAFNGIGSTKIPAIIGVIGNLLRIPFAFILSYSLVDLLPLFASHIPSSSVQVTGVWWGITFSSILKGGILIVWFLLILWKHPDLNNKSAVKNKYNKIISNRLRHQSIQ